MSKQTSTALHVNGIFSDENGNPEHGDRASQGPIALKSDSTSAGAPRPSRLTAVSTADGPVEPTPGYDTIHVYIKSSYCSYSPGNTVVPSGTVSLQSDTGAAASVETSLPTNAFTSGSSPYSAPATPGGAIYTLSSSIGGGSTIILTVTGFSSTGKITVATAGSSTITVCINPSTKTFSYPSGSTVKPGGTVYLKSTAAPAASVSTSLATNAFTPGSSPYSAPTGGASYGVNSSLGTGTTIALFAGGTTGTINVGG